MLKNRLTMSHIGFMFMIFVITGCSTTSTGGFALGAYGSPKWHESAPEPDIRAYYAPKSMIFLQEQWANNWRYPYVREAISSELIRRGEDPQKFYDHEADLELRRLRALRFGADRNFDNDGDLERLQENERRQRFKCIADGGVYSQRSGECR